MVLYEITLAGVNILRIAHSSRNLPEMFRLRETFRMREAEDAEN
jgi:hypothetical protein